MTTCDLHDRGSGTLRGGMWLRMLAVVPFVLLLNSSRVALVTYIEPDGSGTRIITAEASAYHQDDLPRWINDVKAGRSWDMTFRNESGDIIEMQRNFRSQALNKLGHDTKLSIKDFAQNPLSLYTTHEWEEQIEFRYVDDQLQPMGARAMQKQLIYRVVMPGRVESAFVQPSVGNSVRQEDNTAVFTLDAGQQSHIVRVSSRELRWPHLILVAYILVYIAFRILNLTVYTVRNRPRKI